MTETTVSTDLLQALKIFTKLGGNTVGEDLAVLAIDDIALPVEEPGRNLVLERVLDDGDDALKLFGGKVTGALGEIDIGLLADQVGVTATDTSDLGQGVHDLLLAIDVRVQQTDDVLEVRLLSGDERHDGGLSYVDVVLSMLCRVGYRKSSNSPASEWEPRRRHVHQASPVTTLAPSTPSLQLLHVNPCVGLHFESHLNLLPHRTSCMN